MQNKINLMRIEWRHVANAKCQSFHNSLFLFESKKYSIKRSSKMITSRQRALPHGFIS